MRDQLADGFRYDLWANLKWVDILPRFQDRERAETVLRHVLNAQHVWLTRSLSAEEVPNLPADLTEGLQSMNAAWIEFLRISDPEAFVSYTTFKGEPYFNTVEQIARHVVNHGTYHRGQLRGLAQAEGWDDFEDTDLIRWHRETSS
ncbi:MAG: hypothetical protein K1X67_10940 [Fimbriimonadaceae bacterium]|nr:hypothetical protein [Fimbriimonadaceae bacterium]